MVEHGEIIEFKCGEVLFLSSDPSDRLFIIQKGKIGVFKVGNDGTEIPLSVLGEKEFLGELSLLAGTAHSSKAVALTEVKALALSKADVDLMMDQTPSWIVSLLHSVVGRLNKTNEILRDHNIVDENLQSKIDNLSHSDDVF